MTTVSIVILNYNGRKYLEKFLPSVIKYSQGHDIVVADNHSSDDSIEFLSVHFPTVKCILLSHNFGFSEGYNQALAQLNSDLFVLLNSDVEVTKNWLKPMISLFEQDDNLAAAQPKLLDYQRRNKFEYAGGAGGFIDMLGYPFCRGRLFETIEVDTGQYEGQKEIFWATGACLFVRAQLFKEFGGFDSDFFAHMEEIDLCWRLKRSGYKIVCNSESVVYHVGGGTLQYANPQKTYLNFRNSLLTMIKNLTTRELFLKIPLRWVIDYIAIVKFLLTGHFSDSKKIIAAHLYIFKHWRKFRTKHSGRKLNLKSIQGVYPKLLLFSYHIARVRKFSELKF